MSFSSAHTPSPLSLVPLLLSLLTFPSILSIYPSYLFLHASITCCGVCSPRHLISTSGSHFVLHLHLSAPPATSSFPPPPPSFSTSFFLLSSTSIPPHPIRKLLGHQGSLATAPQGEEGWRLRKGGGRYDGGGVRRDEDEEEEEVNGETNPSGSVRLEVCLPLSKLCI